jgi:uncharacterized membrane protein
MSWTAIGLIAAGAYLFKVVGLVVIGPRATAGGRGLEVAALLPPALLAALVAVQTLGDGRSVQLDARVAGVAVAAVAAWRRAPFVVVIAIGAAVTAALRAVA